MQTPAVINRGLDRLRPHPHRGDVIAAGAVPLAVAAFVIELRMTQWALGPRFAVVFLIAVLLLTMGWLAPLEESAPRAYHSTLLVSGLLPMALALVLLAELLGASRPPGSGGLFWAAAVEVILAVAAARRARSAMCTLIAALAAIICVEEFVAWVFQPHGQGTFRAILVLLVVVFASGAIRLRERQRPHAVQMVNAAGLATLLIGLNLASALLLGETLRASGSYAAVFGASPQVAFGWKLFLLAVGFGLIAYAGVDRERGPAFIGVAVLAVFVGLTGFPTSSHGSLVGWPLFLLLIGAVGLAIGLRPRQPLPPPPRSGSESTSETATPTVPLWRNDDTHD
jgi:hypothetical protein